MEGYPRSNHRHSLEQYLTEIGGIPLLSPQEEIELTKRIKKNDREALEKLIQANLRFVVRVAKEYQHQGLPLTDLINEGNLGLIKAAKRFDESRGFKFISYAVWWIRQSILKALADHSRIVRLPVNRIGAIGKVHQTIKELEQKHNRRPTHQEISRELDISISEVSQALTNGAFHVSLDGPLIRSARSPNDNGSMKEFLPNPDQVPPRRGIDQGIAEGRGAARFEDIVPQGREHHQNVLRDQSPAPLYVGRNRREISPDPGESPTDKGASPGTPAPSVTDAGFASVLIVCSLPGDVWRLRLRCPYRVASGVNGKMASM